MTATGGAATGAGVGGAVVTATGAAEVVVAEGTGAAAIGIGAALGVGFAGCADNGTGLETTVLLAVVLVTWAGECLVVAGVAGFIAPTATGTGRRLVLVLAGTKVDRAGAGEVVTVVVAATLAPVFTGVI